jgi:hypothetical protein
VKIPKVFQKTVRFLRKNYFLSIFFLCIGFVGIVILWRFFTSKPHYVYAKVKVSQGLWWASTQKPSLWYAQAIKKGDVEGSLTGEPDAEIVEVHYYPWYASDQFDVYLTVKMDVAKNEKKGTYTFKRSPLAVSSPVDFEFSGAQVSGTVVGLSEEPFANDYQEKIITLTKKSAYPWEFDAIEIGATYFDGEENMFEVLSKNSEDSTNLTSDSRGNFPGFSESMKYITVRAKVKVKSVGGELLFGEEQVVKKGKSFNISTPGFTFEDYKVGEIKDG